MADTNAVTTNDGRSIMLYRANTLAPSATQYLPLTQLRIGVDGSVPTVSDTSILHNIPFTDGTVLDDGSNTLTGSSGADNSTDNIVTYKDGAGVTDVTSQNLLADGTGTNVLKIYTIADLSSAGTNASATQYTGLWFYILNTATLDKLVDTGTALEVKLGSDTSNYYSKTWEDDDLAVGWNWLDMGILNTNTETGTVSGDIDTFIIELTTKLAGDLFIAGDVVYDLLRQWEDTDTVKDFSTGFPSIDYTTLTVTRTVLITADQAVGFIIDNYEWVNEDTARLLGALAKTDGESKASTDQFKIIQKERLL